MDGNNSGSDYGAESIVVLEGLEAVIKRRTDSSSLGFGADVKNKRDEHDVMKKVVPHDLVKYGIVPELVGRLPVITVLEELDETALTRILTEPKNALVKQYRKLFELDGIDLDVTDDAKHEIAKMAIEQKTGARGLRAIVERTLTPVMFDAPSDKSIVGITITGDSVTGEGKPVITRSEESPRIGA
jgi:ATP-dependent Clp protease ATP-binding subunit ClpX